MKKILSLILAITFICPLFFAYAEDAPMAIETLAPTNLENVVTSKAAVLMEASTGKVLFSKNENEALYPASVTKIMTMLLTMEAVDSGVISLDDTAVCSAYAASMGGSQVYMEQGEIMTINELLKAVAVASGNDASVVLAEFLSGTEADFVAKMNERAKQLGMNNTNFENCTGLPSNNHKTSALDIAIMSRELLKHKGILNYTTIWMDTLRDGSFGLSNTNKLVRFYNGANGLKTGSTDSALYCISATALRNDMQLIAVILGGTTSDIRFSEASKLLDFGFAKFVAVNLKNETSITPVKVLKGKKNTVDVYTDEELNVLLDKGTEKKIEKKINMQPDVKAPVEKGQQVGEILVYLDGKVLHKFVVKASAEIKKATFFDYFKDLVQL